MAGLIFDEKTMLDGNVFKFEQRLQSHMNKYVENGMILTTYFSQKESASTVDRGLQTIDELFGNKSPIRFNQINSFPLHGFGQTNPENTDEQQIEDINVEGDATIIPMTITPKQNDFFMVDHLKMLAIFQVTSVSYDSMKQNGFYKIHYRLHSTSTDTLHDLQKQTVAVYHTDLNAIGSDINPIIIEKDFIKINQVHQMVNQMINSYRALFYNERHNCFIYHDPETGMDLFDMCGNEFMSTYSIMNRRNSTKVIVLTDKLRDSQMPYFYNNSVYTWLELGAPMKMLQKFHYQLVDADGYPASSFYLWNDLNIKIIQPLATHQVGPNNQEYSFFDENQFSAFMDDDPGPISSEYDKLIWKFIHKKDDMNIQDVSLDTADALINAVRHIDTFLYTPIIVYIIRKILRMN
ncbi:MAG: hypothetical protein NC548_45835 [Lachnospiraceae bacterium]|nr:hypothetical protein [Lachnospiraceae bacterium]